MDILVGIVLGIIQGLTEFLPVSSSGHLEIAKVIFGYEGIEGENMLMTVVLHFATALSTIFVFRRSIRKIVRESLSPAINTSNSFVAYILISMLPAGLVGFFFEDALDVLFTGKLGFVGAMLLVTAVILLLADRAKHTDKKVNPFFALIIGIAQAVAILPGISRSGATIATSVLLGIDREKAARFSFLMVVPLILGKMAKDMLDAGFELATDDFLPLIAGFLASFVTGIFACQWMITLVKKARLYFFSIYCLIVGLIAILWSL